ncbi:hypothetical protein FB567DRAFT_295393 [Paraphoma chrysanthemicola]|uniref:Uncharacterized protein n=1 Tax=Paraphoma chrysanthemicola TaxID=798071 RepID=A0A8K0RBC1_9PLEO|nr:hypothetical protein FB567DRAFT_295393 [Paraphoma chrysanthemicola]
MALTNCITSKTHDLLLYHPSTAYLHVTLTVLLLPRSRGPFCSSQNHFVWIEVGIFFLFCFDLHPIPRQLQKYRFSTLPLSHHRICSSVFRVRLSMTIRRGGGVSCFQG